MFVSRCFFLLEAEAAGVMYGDRRRLGAGGDWERLITKEEKAMRCFF